MLQVHGVKTNTGIRHANDDVASVVGLRPDRQDPRPITDCTHRVDAVHDEVKNDLLQLDSIGHDRRKVWMQIRLDGNAMLLQLMTGKRQHFRDCAVDIHLHPLWCDVLQHAADAAQYFAGTDCHR